MAMLSSFEDGLHGADQQKLLWRSWDDIGIFLWSLTLSANFLPTTEVCLASQGQKHQSLHVWVYLTCQNILCPVQRQRGDEAGTCGYLLDQGRCSDCEHEPPGCRLCPLPAGQLLP